MVTDWRRNPDSDWQALPDSRVDKAMERHERQHGCSSGEVRELRGLLFTTYRCLVCDRKVLPMTGIKTRPMKERGLGTIKEGYRIISDGDRRTGEHRQKMADYLGRPLRPRENVHHKNGNRSDNRLGNLELWVMSQPPGQRVSDLVKWAREILATYQEEVDDGLVDGSF